MKFKKKRRIRKELDFGYNSYIIRFEIDGGLL